MRTKVDKELLPMKAHYFLFNAGTAPVVPFMATLAKQLGFSTVLVGNIYAVLAITGMLAKPFFAFIADRYQRHRMLFLIGEVLTAVSFFLIMFIPPITPQVEFHCHEGVSSVRFCSTFDACIEDSLSSHYGNQTIACNLKCKADSALYDRVCDDWLHNSTAGSANSNSDCKLDTKKNSLDFTVYLNMEHMVLENECLFFLTEHDVAQIDNQNVTMVCPKDKPFFKTDCDINCSDKFLEGKLRENFAIDDKDALGLYQFWIFFQLLILSWIGMAVVVSIGDAICFAILGERHHLYGNQRLYGSIGWGIFAIISGLLVDKMSHGNVTKDYTIVFWMTAVIIGFDVFASSKLKHTQTSLSPNILKDVGQMFLSVRCVIFFIWCILIGLGTALIWNFLFLYLEYLDGPSCQNSMKTLQGLAMGIQCFGGELPFFFLSGFILKKIGHVHAMSLVLFGFGARFTLYSMLEDPWYVLPIELLNGVTFGLFYATMASYASIVAPPGTEATMQGLVGAIFEGIGVSMGSLIAGILFKVVGGGLTFQYFGIAAFVAFLLHVGVQYYLKRTRRDSDENGSVRYLAPTDAMHMLNETEFSTVS